MPLCPTCSGDQVIRCPECRGEGGDWETGGGVSACDTCQGRGVLPCPTCDGTGEVPPQGRGEPEAELRPRRDHERR
jgi:DnaJ-class molecular chaperone